MSRTKLICTTALGIAATLVVGEMFGNVISKPIQVWRGKQTNINVENLVDLLDVMNQRICNLEEGKET